ncbi:MAG TPA: hypothetical protein VEJ87_00165 [Acidimicrobiales bacterium]|nr:hypothetical protein [Acidimicrobiales bacterium]
MLRSKSLVPDWPTALTTAMLSITVGVLHVLDQGGITKYAGSPWWLGWGYRLVEIGSVVTALALMARRRWIPSWFAALFVGFGPFTVFLLTRLVGLPGDPSDFGNWGDPLGTASLFVEGTLMLTATTALIGLRRVDGGLAPHPATSAHPRSGAGVGVLESPSIRPAD